MIPTPQIETSRYFEWDTPWSATVLIATSLFFVSWTVWQLVREGRVAGFRWWPFFLTLRLSSAAVLLWMILGPTTVMKQTETLPRTLAVYVDTSGSMQIQDDANPVSDRRWKLAGDYRSHAIPAADRVVLFAASLRQQTNRLVDSIEQQSTNEERNEIATKWLTLAEHCHKGLDSDALKGSLSADEQRQHRELVQMLTTDLQSILQDKSWIAGNDPGDRDLKLQQLTEQADQFAVRSRIFAEGLAHASLEAPSESSELPTRLDRMIPAISKSLSDWQTAGNNQYRIRISQFSDTVVELPLSQWDISLAKVDANTTTVRRTDLSNLLKQIRDDAGKEEIAAAVILTDGRHTAESPDDPRDLATQLRLPLYLIPIGHGEMRRDVILHHVNSPTSVIQKDKIAIEGIVTGHRCSGESCEVSLVEKDKVIETKQVVFKTDQDDQRFQFEVPTEEIGRRVFTVRTATLSEEHTEDNNSKSFAVDVVDSVLRILLADGRARWEHQYLVNLFTRQDKIEMDQLKFSPQTVGTGRRKKNPQLPQTVQEWSDYRVVILGDISPKQLNAKSQAALRDYVIQRGGSLVLIAGQNDMPQAFEDGPLEQLLPVEAAPDFSPDRQGYRVEMTVEGKTADAMQLGDDVASTERIWRETCTSMPIYFLSKFNKPKPNSQVLLSAVGVGDSRATNDSPALLCWQSVGAGRVAYLSSPATYQLRNQNGDTNHHRFWGQFIRWLVSRSALSGSKSVRVVADKSHYSGDDVAQLVVELSDTDGQPVIDAAPVIDAIKGGEVISNINLVPDAQIPGRYLGTFATNQPQRYTLRASGPDVEELLKQEKYTYPVQIEIDFEPGLDRELIDPRSDRPLLEHLAEHTGGQVLEPTALSELPKAITLEPRIRESSERTPLWDHWWCLWVLLGSSTIEWMIRKRIGLA